VILVGAFLRWTKGNRPPARRENDAQVIWFQSRSRCLLRTSIFGKGRQKLTLHGVVLKIFIKGGFDVIDQNGSGPSGTVTEAASKRKLAPLGASAARTA
jgi:hypothetical protein